MSEGCMGGLVDRVRKSMVSWYPGYQPISNLAANFWLDRRPSQPSTESKQPKFENKQPMAGWSMVQLANKHW